MNTDRRPFPDEGPPRLTGRIVPGAGTWRASQRVALIG